MIIYTTCSEATFKACFGCNDQAFWIGIESLGDQALTDVRPVRIGRVDEIDAQFECPTQYPDDFIVISRFSPNPIACNSHGPETQGGIREVAPDAKRATPLRRFLSQQGVAGG